MQTILWTPQNNTCIRWMRPMPMRFKVIYVGSEHGFSLSGIPLGGDQYIKRNYRQHLQAENVQEKLILFLQCIPYRIQHLLAAVPIGLSRSFAQQHDEAISNAVAAILNSTKETNYWCRGKYLSTASVSGAWKKTWSSSSLQASCRIFRVETRKDTTRVGRSSWRILWSQQDS